MPVPIENNAGPNTVNEQDLDDLKKFAVGAFGLNEHMASFLVNTIASKVANTDFSGENTIEKLFTIANEVSADMETVPTG